MSSCILYLAPAIVTRSSLDALRPSENKDESRLDDLAARLEPFEASLDAAPPIDNLRRSEWDRVIVEGEFERELSAECPFVGAADSGESDGEACSVAGDRVRGPRRLVDEIRTRSLAGAGAGTGTGAASNSAGDSARCSMLPSVASWMLFRLVDRVGTIGMNAGLGLGLLDLLLATVLVELLARGS